MENRTMGHKQVANQLSTNHRHVHVASIQLEVDLLVDASLAFLVVVLTTQRHFDGCGGKDRENTMLKVVKSSNVNCLVQSLLKRNNPKWRFS